ncbi:hypothetical protein TNCV_4763151 [Trichonephila clavipes]|nr:hypothetical protein TNCV_4763151 [Trichonephila clavipes]
MVRKKQKVIPERHRNAKPTLTTSRDASQSAVAKEPPGETSMEIPLPTTTKASRPGTPDDSGPTFANCSKLQELTTLIDYYSTTLETTHTLLQRAMQNGIKDPNNPLVRNESSYMELTNERLQKAVSEYASLPPCDNPNCTRHNSNNTPAKNNSPDPSPLPTPVPTKRKENEDSFTPPPLRKLTKTTLSNSNPEINFKLNQLTNLMHLKMKFLKHQ